MTLISHTIYMLQPFSHTLRLDQSMALLPPPPLRVPLSSLELHLVTSFDQYSTHQPIPNSHITRF